MWSDVSKIVLACGVATTAWFAGVEGAVAQDKSPKEEAQVYFDRGAQLYVEGKYAKSIVQFRKAHRTYEHPIFRYNIMRSHIRLGHCEKALEVARKIEETKRLRDKTVAQLHASASACRTAVGARDLTTAIGEGGTASSDAFDVEDESGQSATPTDKPDCPPGKTRNEDTAGHCCWPGQGWNGEECVGRPECPGTTSVVEDGTSCGCSGDQKLSHDGIHCCWPKQAWSDAKGRCVGTPKCPELMTRRGRGCVPDPDKDGIGKGEDGCPNESETVNGFRDEDGCPEPLHVVASVEKQKATLTADGDSAVDVGGTVVFVEIPDDPKAEGAKAEIVGRGFVVKKSGSDIRVWLPEGHSVTAQTSAFPGCWPGQSWEPGEGCTGGTPQCPDEAFEYDNSCYLDRDDDNIALEADACPLEADTDQYADTDGCPGSGGRNMISVGAGVPYGGFAGLKYERFFGVRFSVGAAAGAWLPSPNPNSRQDVILPGFVGDVSLYVPDLMGHALKVTAMVGPTARPFEPAGISTITDEEANTLYYGPAAGLSYSYIGQLFHFRLGIFGMARYFSPEPDGLSTYALQFEMGFGIAF